jgi:hypothetical protein
VKYNPKSSGEKNIIVSILVIPFIMCVFGHDIFDAIVL